MLISILEKINHLNNMITSPLDRIIESLSLEEWIEDALLDSLHLLPLLFLIFVIIELVEFYFADKLSEYIKKASRSSIIIGAMASIMPQCGFSVIAASLYSRKLITRGCLMAVFLGTSDETIPVLLANPSKAYLVIPIIGIKLLIAILFGYFIDIMISRKDKYISLKNMANVISSEKIHEEGCCNHNPETANKKELILHPIIHTFNIFCFILFITIILNYFMFNCSLNELIANINVKYLQSIFMSLFGLIPNCATSIAITMLLIKGTISFGAAMSGLLANAGLGLLVLLRNNDFKDTVKIILLLVSISIIIGTLIDFLV